METFSILGRLLAAEVRSPALSRWLRRGWFFPEHAVPHFRYTIRLEELAAMPAPQEGTPLEVRLHGFTLAGMAGNSRWSFGDGEAGVRLELEAEGSRIAAWGVDRPGRAAATLAALALSVVESLRTSGLLPLHAAVAVRDGAATALAGTSGAGKSTTLWRALRAGWAPLAEDFSWLDPGSGTVYGWDRGLRLHAQAFERFGGGLPAAELTTDADGKRFLAYDRLPVRRVSSAPLARLAVLEQAPESARTVVEPISSQRAVRAWWEAVGVPLAPEVRVRVAGEIAALVTAVPTVRLALTADAGPLTEL